MKNPSIVPFILFKWRTIALFLFLFVSLLTGWGQVYRLSYNFNVAYTCDHEAGDPNYDQLHNFHTTMTQLSYRFSDGYFQIFSNDAAYYGGSIDFAPSEHGELDMFSIAMRGAIFTWNNYGGGTAPCFGEDVYQESNFSAAINGSFGFYPVLSSALTQSTTTLSPVTRITLGSAYGFPSSVYNWEMSLDGGVLWKSLPAAYQNREIITFSLQDILSDADSYIGQDISFRINPCGTSRSMSNTVTYSIMLAPPAVKAGNISEPSCSGSSDGTVTIAIDRNLGSDETLILDVYKPDNSLIRSISLAPGELIVGASYLISGLPSGNCQVKYHTEFASGVSSQYVLIPIFVPFVTPVHYASTATKMLFPTDDNGIITINATGGTGSFEYALWPEGDAVGSWKSFSGGIVQIPSLTAGTYNIKVRDTHQCEATEGTTSRAVEVLPPGDVAGNAIVIGKVSGSLAYTDTRNTAIYNNDTGFLANDVYYKFTIDKALTVSINHCGSEVRDTYLSLLNNNFNEIAANDDYYGSGACANTAHASIKRILPAGTYYIVSEGFGFSNGNITTNVDFVLPEGDTRSNAIDAGTDDGMYFLFQDTRNTAVLNDDDAIPGNDVYHRFTLTKAMDVSLSHCDSPPGTDTYLQLMNAQGTVISESDSNNGHECSEPGIAALRVLLLPGTYYVSSNLQGGGNSQGAIDVSIKANLPEGDIRSNAIHIGTKFRNFTYTDTRNTSFYNDDNAHAGNDVYHKITITKKMQVTLSHCGSQVAGTFMQLLDVNGTEIASGDNSKGSASCSNPSQAFISLPLMPGTYYVVSESKGTDDALNGNITLTVTGELPPGDTFGNAIDVVATGGYSSFADTRDTKFYNDNNALAGNDIYYRLTLDRQMQVSVSHCGSQLANTRLQLLNSMQDVVPGSSFQSGWQCSDGKPFLQYTLPAGVYYLVAEDDGTNTGSMVTTIEFAPVTGTAAGDAGYLTPEEAAKLREYTLNPQVGEIAGAFDVSGTGGAVYTVPITVPPGVGGIQPSMAVTYNSQSGNGLLGMGMNLAGLSVITRAPSSVYYDGQARPLQVDTAGHYALDGARLLLTSGRNGTVGAEYRTEAENFTKITVKEANQYGALWLEAQTKDGITIRYGSAGGRLTDPTLKDVVLAWYPDYVQDARGNSMQYRYLRHNNTLYLSSIDYSGNETAGTSHRFSVRFTYGGRTDTIKSHYSSYGCIGNDINGAPLYGSYNLKAAVCKLLTGCTVLGDGYALRSYEYIYTKDIYSRLAAVREKDAQGIQYSPVAFDWNLHLPVEGFASETLNVPHSNISGNVKFFSADLDGDGKADIVTVKNNYGSFDVQRTLSGNGQTNSHSFDTGDQKSYLLGEFSLKGRLENDGREQLILAVYCPDKKETRFYWVLDKFNGVLNPYLTSYSTGEPPLINVADMDGDGHSEIVLLEKQANGSGGTYQLAFFDRLQWHKPVSLSLPNYPTDLHIADYNGDGLPDIGTVSAFRINRFTWKFNVFFNRGGSLNDLFKTEVSVQSDFASSFNDLIARDGDFNGDGLPDLLCNHRCTSRWYLFLNKGNGSFAISNLAIPYQDQLDTSADDDKFNYYVYDFDGDGKSDVVVTWAKYRSTRFLEFHTDWMRSTGTGFELVKETGVDTDITWSSLITMGDFDGDGRPELFARGYDLSTDEGARADMLDNRIFRNPRYTYDAGLLKSVTGATGVLTSVRYQPATNNRIVTKGTEDVSGWWNVALSIPVVTDVLRSGVTPAGNTYTYGNARWSPLKGFLGFGTTTVKQNEQQVTSTTVAELNKTWLVPEKSKTTTTYSDGMTQKAEAVFRFVNKGTSRYLQLPDKKSVTDLYGNTETTAYVFDETTGNPLSETVTSGSGMTRQTEYSGYIAAGSYMENTPRMVTSTSKHPDDANRYVTTSAFEYDPVSGSLLSKKELKGTDKEVTTVYSDFDAWKNPRKITVMPATGNVATETLEYDPTGRFVTKRATPLGSIQTAYDQWGNVLKTSDDANRVTANAYDGFGRLVKTIYPDGLKTVSMQAWGNDANKRFYRFTQPDGQPWTKVWCDDLGRETLTESVGVKGSAVTATTIYNARGQVETKISSTGTLNTSCTYEYDSQGRVVKETYGNGRTVAYFYGNREISVTEDGKTTTKKLDAWGNPLTVTDPDGNVTSYTYYSSGKPKTITTGGATWTMEYDAAGNRTLLSDPDAGEIRTVYNALGQVVRQESPMNDADYQYDAYNRLYHVNRAEGTTTYAYVPSGNGRGQVESIVGPGGNNLSYTYDLYDRILSETRGIAGRNYTFGYGYDATGNLTTVTYPSGYSVSREYDGFGFPDKVKAGANILWQQGDYSGAVSHGIYGGNITAYSNRTTDGRLMQLISHSANAYTLRHFNYDFNALNGNLTQRYDQLRDVTENFRYDNLDRLKNVSGNRGQSIEYFANGNIQSKSNAGTFSYGGMQPHAVDSVRNPSSLISTQEQVVGYTSFDKMAFVNEGKYSLSVDYMPDHKRGKTELTRNDTIQKTTIFAGDYEKEILENGTVRELHYVQLGGDIFAVMVRNGGTDSLYYVHPDHLGSYTLVTDQSGNVKQRAEYDPWGLRTITEGKLVFSRGFTGHEHLDEFRLINMNGRMYDPVLGRFLSPDPYVQAPDFSQSFNRYSYCVNNPLKYSDPSGELFFIFPHISWSKHGGLSIGVTVGLGVPGLGSVQAGIGYNTKSGGYGFVGASAGFNSVSLSYSGSGGWNVGYSAGFSIQNGFPIGTNIATAGVNYNLSSGSLSGNVSALNIDNRGTTFDPSFSAMFFPEHFTNMVKGGGFRSNQSVFERIMNGAINPTNSITPQQGILDYFGFDGVYNPSDPNFSNEVGGGAAFTDPTTGQIVFGNGAFTRNYGWFERCAYEELFHQRLVLSGKSKTIDRNTNEWLAQQYLYKTQGVFKNAGNDYLDRIIYYGNQLGKYEYNITPNGPVRSNSIPTVKLWHTIYKHPRLW